MTNDLVLGAVALTSFGLWQTAIMLLVVCHLFTVRTFWRMTVRHVRTGLVAVGACIGWLVVLGGRTSWQLRLEQEVTDASRLSPLAVYELFAWSLGAFILAVVLAREVRLLFNDLGRRLESQ